MADCCQYCAMSALLPIISSQVTIVGRVQSTSLVFRGMLNADTKPKLESKLKELQLTKAEKALAKLTVGQKDAVFVEDKTEKFEYSTCYAVEAASGWTRFVAVSARYQPEFLFSIRGASNNDIALQLSAAHSTLLEFVSSLSC